MKLELFDGDETVRVVGAVVVKALAKGEVQVDFGPADGAPNVRLVMSQDEAFELGSALHMAGRSDEALVQLSRAAELDPSLALAHYRRGRILHDLVCPEETLPPPPPDTTPMGNPGTGGFGGPMGTAGTFGGVDAGFPTGAGGTFGK